MDQTTSFGYWVRRQRKALDLTQAALARRVGCARITISKIECDERRPSRKMAECLADALGISEGERRCFIQVALAERSPDGLALPSKFLPSSSPGYTPGFIYNLPAPATALVGRKREVTKLSRLLRSERTRLVTLLGLGGVGKTRLAIQVGVRLGRYFEHGVAFVPLSSIRDPRLVAAKIAEALGVRETHGRSLVDVLMDTLRSCTMLLVLDNFEHLLDGANLVSQLLVGAPNLKVLVTSRAALRLTGEYEYPLPPLQLPELVYDQDQFSPLDAGLLPALVNNESFQLFTERASARSLDFEIDGKTAPYIAEICRRLDGLPLAIELAAAQIKTHRLQTILARLADRFDLLQDGPRDVPARMQTLRASFDWSYDLLGEAGKCLFNHLGVFMGGCSQDAALAVCWGEPLELDSYQLTRELSSLVDQSMLQREEGLQGEPRFSMLATLREYALQQLEERGEEGQIRRQHLEFFTHMAEDAENHLWNQEQETWGKRLETNLDNLRVAMSWALDRSEARKDEIELGARLAGALWYFWYCRGYLHEGRRWLAKALERAVWPGKARAKALTAAGTLAWQQGENPLARRLADQAIDLWRRLEDLSGLGGSLHMMGHMVFDQQDYEAARHLFLESLDVYEATGDDTMRAPLISDLGLVAYHQEDYRKARQLCEHGLALFQELDNQDGIASTSLRLGDLARLEDQYGRAFDLYQHARSVFEELGLKLEIASTYHKLGYIYQKRGDTLRARNLFAQALEMQVEMGNKQGIIECLAGLGGLAAAIRQPGLAAQLFGAAQAMLDATGLPLAPADNAEWGKYEALAKERLDRADYERLWRQGFSIPYSQAVKLALEGDYLS